MKVSPGRAPLPAGGRAAVAAGGRVHRSIGARALQLPGQRIDAGAQRVDVVAGRHVKVPQRLLDALLVPTSMPEVARLSAGIVAGVLVYGALMLLLFPARIRLALTLVPAMRVR